MKGILNQVLDVLQKAPCRRAIHQPVVKGWSESHHLAGNYLAFHHRRSVLDPYAQVLDR
jgi:hypothetical protein